MTEDIFETMPVKVRDMTLTEKELRYLADAYWVRMYAESVMNQFHDMPLDRAMELGRLINDDINDIVCTYDYEGQIVEELERCGQLYED